MERFSDKVALVTGAASGIGYATALRLASEGARVACVDVQADPLQACAEAIGAAGGQTLVRVCDVTDPDQVADTVAAALEKFGRLDVLCNIAGILRFGHSHETSLEEWNRVLAVNLTGTFLFCRAALPHLVASGGNIVNMASTAAIKAQPWSVAYAASKGGVLAMTYSLAIEYGKQGVRVNAILPASIKTPIMKEFSLPEGANPDLLQRIMPLNDFADPEACAGSIAYLASDDASHVNGAQLVVDGGMTA